jgi:two-component system nitrogen regulation response regulator GlnG
VVAATNRDLKAMVAARTFRDDLYYRLSVFPVTVPPLRERSEDIPILARHFVTDLARRLGRRIEDPSEAVLARLARHGWPGNIRELQNVLERAAILAQGGDLEVPDGPPPAEPCSDLAQGPDRRPRAADVFDVTAFIREQLAPASARDVYAETHRRVDRILLATALDHTLGNQREAARLMGISRQTMRGRLRSLGIHVSHTVETGDDSAATSLLPGPG